MIRSKMIIDIYIYIYIQKKYSLEVKQNYQRLQLLKKPLFNRKLNRKLDNMVKKIDDINENEHDQILEEITPQASRAVSGISMD